MKLTESDKAKLNDFKIAYNHIFNPNNDNYLSLVINTIFLNIEKNYEEFSDDIKTVSIVEENDKLNVIKPVNGHYSLLDFLINRAIKNIQSFEYHPSEETNCYKARVKKVCVRPNRYDRYIDRCNQKGIKYFSDDFIHHQKMKSIIHESGHALQNKRECDFDIPALEEFVRKIRDDLGNKYDFNTSFENISNNDFFKPFNSEPLMEGLNEMYASLFSGVLNYSTDDSILREGLCVENAVIEYNGKSKTSLRRNCFNGYRHYRYFYLMRSLVSKRSIFNSMYFARNDMMDEFYSRYKDIIDKYELDTDVEIKNEIANYPGNFVERLLKYIGNVYQYHQNTSEYDSICKYEFVLDNIMIEAIERKINSLTVKDPILEETLANAYLDANSYIIDNKYEDSYEKKQYNLLHAKLCSMKLPEKQVQSTKTISYGIYNVNIIRNPSNNMKVIVLFKNDNFEVNPIIVTGPNDFEIDSNKNSVCKLIENYLNKFKQSLINNPSGITNMFLNINSFIREITVARSNDQFEDGHYKMR